MAKGILTQKLRDYVLGQRLTLADLENVKDKNERQKLLNLRRVYDFRIETRLKEKIEDMVQTISDAETLKPWFARKDIELPSVGLLRKTSLKKAGRPREGKRRASVDKMYVGKFKIKCPYDGKNKNYAVFRDKKGILFGVGVEGVVGLTVDQFEDLAKTSLSQLKELLKTMEK